MKPAAASVVCERCRVLVSTRWAASCLALSGEKKKKLCFLRLLQNSVFVPIGFGTFIVKGL